jgi:hypothetical protein
MQGMSDMVTSGDAKIGDIVENVGGKVIGGIDNGVEILPFKCNLLFKIMGSNGKLLGTETVSDDNINAPFECEYDGESAKRFYTQQYFVLLPSELESGNSLPFVLEFKSTALSAGKDIYRQMYVINKENQLPPPAKTFMLVTERVSNNKGTFAVPKVSVCRDTRAAELEKALSWFLSMREGGVRVHEDEE